MTWFLTLLPYLLSMAVSLSLAAYAYPRRSVPGAQAFAVSLVGQALWAFGYIFELSSKSLPAKIGWDSFQYIGFFIVALGVLIMARQYVGRRPPFSRRLWLLLLSVPLLVAGATLRSRAKLSILCRAQETRAFPANPKSCNLKT